MSGEAPLAGIVSFRFGDHDGVSVEARKWAWALERLGYRPRWVAGAGTALDVTLPGLAIDADVAVTAGEVRTALEACEVVVVENLLSLPLNPEALAAVSEALRGRPAVIRHHDLPWQRDRFVRSPAPPDDRSWTHVTINELSRRQLGDRGIEATTLYNRFTKPETTGARTPEPVANAARPLLLHPTRAIRRKNVPAAVRLAEDLGGTYWLLGPAEDGYTDELEEVLAGARCHLLRGAGMKVGDAYAACDAVVYPSTWEGFGNPTIESAMARRPLAVAPYPVLEELSRFGFRWFPVDDPEPLRRWLHEPSGDLLDHNEAIAAEHFSLEDLPAALGRVLERVL